MKMYIPRLRDRVKLTAPWTFKLYNECRNSSLFSDEFRDRARVAETQVYYDWRSDKISREEWLELRAYSEPMTWPEGTVLSIDRIYIKNGLEDFDSVSFRLVDPKRKGIRFWAKLSDVNQMEFEPVIE